MEQTNLSPQNPVTLPDASLNTATAKTLPTDPTPPSKGSNLPMLLLASVVVVALVGGAYYMGMQKSAQVMVAQVPVNTDISVTNPDIQEETSIITSTFVMTESFQSMLEKDCKMIALGANSSILAIQESLLPVTVDSQKLLINYRVPNSFICSMGAPDFKYNYVMVELSNKLSTSYINIYNSDSEEPGHGGVPYLGSFDTVIKNEENIKYSIELGYGSGPTIIGSVPLYMKAEKMFTLSNGETIFVNSIMVAIANDDPRWVKFLNKYGVDSSNEPGKKELENSVTTKEVQATFFADPDTLGQSEKSAMVELKTRLDSVTLK